MSEPLSVEQLQKLCDKAIQAAQEAGQFIQSVDRNAVQRKFKEAGSSQASQIVTEVDVRSEAIIGENLREISEQFDIAFVGEESSPKATEFTADLMSECLLKPYFWCVDPLDGTLPFVEGRAGYAVSIALLEQSGKPLIGVVYDPAESTLIHAIIGQGVYRDLAPLSSVKQTSETLVVFADASFKAHENYDRTLDTLNACAQNFGLDGVTFLYGSGAVKNACQVLDYSAACYVKLPKNEDGGGSIWDYAATACIVSEAGSWASNIHGQPLELNRQGSTFMNHQGVIYASSEQIARYLINAL
ncbi:MAG: 3'(2'),5'-bisphosphate nucleotidase CysQ [Pseudomonadales bacterium]